ncbi:MAG TPA: DUF167 domain-containing protein [Candidatus Hydrothermia bacterium]|nr:DUF167 domain-containing protein [Candidatus Hydrothermia bacterium]HOL23909.1 DUF167 domain-containing protein [Candidatus Hydrothermia bacterium]HOP31834.1 DUF167 domain-containing protein [Candidatus Hydrothermia bacterium]HPO78914.1 DUF167 domain-containing protein [Candidatus Hydrothermia bacterium]
MSLIMRIKVEPSSKRYGVKLLGDKIVVMVKEDPVQGKANEDLIRFLCKKMDIPESKVRVVSGIKSRNKLVEILEDFTLEEVKRRLEL